ncbi:MAG: MATE family efflux transporter [Lachnospiraceae bacterium]|nr:MATE family efflux transporter [Lachnospiraceae bacterium]
MIAVGVGTAVGLNALLSRKIGEHKIEEACQTATTGLFLMLLTSLIFSLTGIFFSDTISSKMTADPELETLCKQYLSINLVYCWGIFLQTYAQRLLQAVGDTVLSMFSLIIGAVLNTILNPIMIFGLLGCPAMGVRGAAIATVIGQITGAIAALLFNCFRNPIIHVRLKNYHFKWQDVADIYRVGLPTIIMQAIGSIMTFVVNRILLDVSATAVAFWGIYYKLQNFLMMPINGLGQAAIPIVGYNYGNKKFQRVQQTWNILLPTGAVIVLCGTVIFWCFPGQLLQLFSASPEMLTLGIPALKIISVSFVMSAITILCGYFVSGLGNGIINMVSAAIRQLILLVPSLWIFIKISGISHGWYAFWNAEIVACVYSYCMSHKLLKTISQS